MMRRNRGLPRLNSLVASLVAVAASFACAAPALAADNLPPEITVPGAQTVNEDTNLTLSGANAISVADPDSDPDDIEVGLSAGDGVLTLATLTGLTITTGDGTSDPAITFEGTNAEVNAALDGLIYRGNLNYNGPDTIEVETDDQGNNGDPPDETDSDSVGVTVSAVNDNPANGLPGAQAMDEDTTHTFSAANANAITVSDVDAGPTPDLRVTLQTLKDGFPTGTLTLATTAGLNITTGDGTADTTVTFEGTLVELNAALDGLGYTPVEDYSGTDAGQINMTTNDLGNTGSGGAKQGGDTPAVQLTITADDDEPKPVLPFGWGTYKDHDLELSAANANAVQVGDDSPETDLINVSVTSTHGTMDLANDMGLLVAGADGSAAFTLEGTRTQVNAALSDMTFVVETGFTGAATISAEAVNLTSGGGPSQTGSGTTDIRVDEPEEGVYFGGSKETLLVGSVPAAIGRAELDGGGGANLVAGPQVADNPAGIAIDLVEERIYWSVTPTSNLTPSIYSANLDGTDRQLFASNAAPPPGTIMSSTPNALVIDQATRRIYWTTTQNVSPFTNQAISYANLDDPGTGGGSIVVGGAGNLFNAAGGPRPVVLDRDGGQLYWGNTMRDAIGFSPAPGSAGSSGVFTVSGDGPSDPLGIAFDPDTDRLLWANSTGTPTEDRIRVATLNGTANIAGSVFDIGTAPSGGFRSMALDPAAGRIYWGLTSGRIGHVALDGSGGDAGEVLLGDANHNNLDGVTLLKDPEPVSPPSVTGEMVTGSALTCSGDAWAADLVSGGLYRMPRTVSYGWTLNGAEIPGAASSSFTPTQAGEYRCISRATNFAGTNSQESAAAAVAAAPDTADGTCERLRKKLAALTKSLKRSSDPGKSAKLRAKRKAIRKKLRKNGC